MEIRDWFHNHPEWLFYIVGICIFVFGFYYYANQISEVISLIMISIGIVFIAGGILKKPEYMTKMDLKKMYLFIFLTSIIIFFYFMIKMIIYFMIKMITAEPIPKFAHTGNSISIPLWEFLTVVCIVIIVGIITLLGSRILVYKEKIEYNRSLMKLIELHKIDPDKAFKIIEKMSESAAKEGYQISMKLSKITKKVTSSLKENTNQK